ncbi:MAG TPA: nuclear transport factor 2 family protein [Gemmatimonadaceae bacterium]|nr:nuclear transport factor 2 family protein [Gemmatimonadaceae bacterium]
MKHTFIALLLLLLHPALCLAQAASNPAGAPEQIRSDLTRIEQEIGQANFDCDYRYFERIEADEFIFTDPSGTVTSRAQDLAGEKNCRKTGGTYALDDVRVAPYGNIAVVTARATTTTTNAGGTPVVRRNRFTDVFVWRMGRWQLVAGHSSRIS